jgi:hypothetical protein
MKEPADPELHELDKVRCRLRRDNTRLAVGILSLPLHLLGPVVESNLIGFLRILGISAPPPIALTSLATLGSCTAASILGWTMLLPLLAGNAGWRSQLACLVAIPLAALSMLTITKLAGTLIDL